MTEAQPAESPRPVTGGDADKDVLAPGSAVEENVAKEDPAQIVMQPPGPETDAATAKQVKAEGVREEKRNKWRIPLLVVSGSVYVILSAVAICTVFFVEDKIDALLQVYALVMPVLTAIIGTAIGFLFAESKSGGR